jgi:hypothetical protein
MSYEGFVEYLCAKGHHSTNDAYDEDLTRCPRCGGPLVWNHVVNQTNGVVEGNPGTNLWPLEQIGEEAVTVMIPLYRVPPTAPEKQG